jgi:hypothetical protein
MTILITPFIFGSPWDLVGRDVHCVSLSFRKHCTDSSPELHDGTSRSTSPYDENVAPSLNTCLNASTMDLETLDFFCTVPNNALSCRVEAHRPDG